jgi:DNA-binding response OmpR family regulator
VVLKNGKAELFSPLFRDCVLALTSSKLPIKERRLLSILKRYEGRIVSKNDIYDAVWRGQEIGSEWALNALIYRLRKHPAFIAQRYSIENHKKLGYSLQKQS